METDGTIEAFGLTRFTLPSEHDFLCIAIHGSGVLYVTLRPADIDLPTTLKLYVRRVEREGIDFYVIKGDIDGRAVVALYNRIEGHPCRGTGWLAYLPE
jgi:hypothetical protein